MTDFNLVVLVTISALTLLLRLAKVNPLISLGLPGVVGIWLGLETVSTRAVGNALLDGMNSFSLGCAMLWILTYAICVESGIFGRSKAALALLFGHHSDGHHTTTDRALGTFSSLLVLVMVASMPLYADQNLVSLFALVPGILFALVVFLRFLLYTPRFSTVTVSRMVGSEGDKAKKVNIQTAAVGPNGSLFRISGRSGALITLLPITLTVALCVLVLMTTPLGLAELAGPTFILMLALALAGGQSRMWAVLAGARAWTGVAHVASQVLGAMIFAKACSELGLTAWVGQTVGGSGVSTWLILMGVTVATALVGQVFGPYAATAIVVSLASSIWTVSDLSAPNMGTQMTAVSILSAMLAVAGAVGGAITYLLSARFPRRYIPL